MENIQYRSTLPFKGIWEKEEGRERKETKNKKRQIVACTSEVPRPYYYCINTYCTHTSPSPGYPRGAGRPHDEEKKKEGKKPILPGTFSVIIVVDNKKSTLLVNAFTPKAGSTFFFRVHYPCGLPKIKGCSGLDRIEGEGPQKVQE